MRFEVGKEYKTIRKNMEVGVRTFKVEKITRKKLGSNVEWCNQWNISVESRLQRRRVRRYRI